MRWLVLVLALSLVYGATLKRECSVSDFVELGYSNHDPKERSERAWVWLEESGPHCTKEQLALIYNNLATVLGAVDSMKIRSKIEKLYERAK
jgi:hypothetical protein